MQNSYHFLSSFPFFNKKISHFSIFVEIVSSKRHIPDITNSGKEVQHEKRHGSMHVARASAEECGNEIWKVQ